MKNKKKVNKKNYDNFAERAAFFFACLQEEREDTRHSLIVPPPKSSHLEALGPEEVVAVKVGPDEAAIGTGVVVADHPLVRDPHGAPLQRTSHP